MSTPKIVVKTVTHRFNNDEKIRLGRELSEAWSSHGKVEREEDAIKKQYKARLSEIESRIGVLSQSIQDGFDMREERVQVRYYPKERIKRYWLENDDADANPEAYVLQEPMVHDDHQQELIQADSRFENREEIALFPPTETDRAVLLVGRIGELWYSALRINIGVKSLTERMDSEQPGCKVRWDAINLAAERYSAWLLSELGKDAEAGFHDPLCNAIQPHRERVE